MKTSMSMRRRERAPEKKILLTAASMGLGGTETFVTNVLGCIDREKFQADVYIYDGSRMEHGEEAAARNSRIFVSGARKGGRFAVFREIGALRKFLKEHPYDIVHCNECSFAALLQGTIGARLAGGSLVIAHSHSASRQKNTLADQCLRSLFKAVLSWSADYGLACSDWAGESKFTKRFRESDRYRILNNAIHTERYLYDEGSRREIREKFNLGERDFVIGNVGRLAKVKNQQFLLDILKALLEKKDAYLMIVGGGELESQLKEKARSLGIAQKVLFAGSCQDAEKYYSAMDIFVMPSLFEGFPYTAVEAQANGLKCLVSDRMTRTVNITGDVSFCRLEEGAGFWAEQIRKTGGGRTEETKGNAVLQKFDLRSEVKELEQIYLDGTKKDCRLRKRIPPLLLSLYREKGCGGILLKYWKGRRAVRRQAGSGSDFPKVVFIIGFPETWNSVATVWQGLAAEGAKPLILCVPKPESADAGEYRAARENEAWDFFRERQPEAIDARDPSSGKWFDLKAEKPDYVVYTRPYQKEYPEPYRSTCVCGYAKVCYIPYAYSQTVEGLSYTTFNYEFILTASLVFVPSRIRLKECGERFAVQKRMHSHQFLYKGYPRFDLVQGSGNATESGTGKKTILWLPRWTVGASGGQKESNFLRYLEFFMEYQERNPEIRLIIRPHPLLFQTIAERHILTESRLQEIRSRIEEAPNICMDTNKDYMFSFRESDYLVSDYSSLVIEYFVSGKPVIYCGGAENLNREMLLMHSVLYHGREWQDVEGLLTRLIGGEDPMKEKRKEVIGQLMPSNAGRIGQEISACILEDYRKTQSIRKGTGRRR